MKTAKIGPDQHDLGQLSQPDQSTVNSKTNTTHGTSPSGYLPEMGEELKKKTQRCQRMNLRLLEGGVWFLQVGEMTYVQ